jgi:hypothetical protein
MDRNYVLSIIIPVSGDPIESIITTFSEVLTVEGQGDGGHSEVEVLIVDSFERESMYASSCNTMREVRFVGVTSAAASNRGMKLQAGIDASSGAVILLHHPRSLIDPAGLLWLYKKAATVDYSNNNNNNNNNNINSWWGGFTHKFDRVHWLLRFTSWYSNRIRPMLSRILYLDHCIFFTHNALTQKIPPVSVFEDTELSKILRESCRDPPVIAPYLSVTSALRFTVNGVFQQAMLNQWMKLLYYCGLHHQVMNATYEKGLGLNGSVDCEGE